MSRKRESFRCSTVLYSKIRVTESCNWGLNQRALLSRLNNVIENVATCIWIKHQRRHRTNSPKGWRSMLPWRYTAKNICLPQVLCTIKCIAQLLNNRWISRSMNIYHLCKNQCKDLRQTWFWGEARYQLRVKYFSEKFQVHYGNSDFVLKTF